MTEMHSISGSNFVCAPPPTCSDCLAHSVLASELSDAEISILYGLASIKPLSKGETLISEGDEDNHLYVVAKGEVDIFRGNGAQQQIHLARLGPGTVTGELAFLDKLKRTATVKAATDECCVIGLERERLETVLNSHPQLIYKVMGAIIRAAHTTVGKMDKTYSEVIRYIQG